MKIDRIVKKAMWMGGVSLLCMAVAPDTQSATIYGATISTLGVAPVTFSGDAVALYVDQTDTDVKGYCVNGVTYVPAESFLYEALGVNVNFDEVNGILQLQFGDHVMHLQIANGQMECDGTQVNLCGLPFYGYVGSDSDEAEVYVPYTDIANICGFVNTSAEASKIAVTSIYPYRENGCQEYYTGQVVRSFLYNDKEVCIDSTLPGMVKNGIIYVPLEELYHTASFGGTLQIDGDTITAQRGNAQAIYYCNEARFVVNGQEGQMEAAMRTVDYEGQTFHLVPASAFIAGIGAQLEDVELEQNRIVITKSVDTFLDWQAAMPEESFVKSVKGTLKGKKDYFTIQCANTKHVKITHTATKIKILLQHATNSELLSTTLYDANKSSDLSMKQSDDGILITITKESGVNYVSRYGNGVISIHLGETPIAIAVDCGHGAYTVGKRTPPMPFSLDFDKDGKIDVRKGQSIREHTMNVGVGKVLAKELERQGFRVYRSAFGSRDVSLYGRQKNIKHAKVKYSISVHFNAAGNGARFNGAKGVEVYYHSKYKKSSKKFARAVYNQMIKGTKQSKRGVKPKLLAMCNTKAMHTQASILVECAFMTNLYEAKNMCGNAKFWNETGTEIAKGVCQYTNRKYFEADK